MFRVTEALVRSARGLANANARGNIWSTSAGRVKWLFGKNIKIKLKALK